METKHTLAIALAALGFFALVIAPAIQSAMAPLQTAAAAMESGK